MTATQRRWASMVTSCVIFLAGCASLGPQLPMDPAGDSETLSDVSGVRTLNANGEFETVPAQEVGRRLRAVLGERPMSILALSSGGASGAFGAGALVGATRAGNRREFAVVTGVSSGALLAPFAFLGPSQDLPLKSIFADGLTDGLLQPRGVSALFGSSLYSDQRLRKLIERYANDDMLAAIAAEAAKGRLLLVATTNFATGEPVIWDLGSIARYGGRDAKPLVQSLLLASASVQLPANTDSLRNSARSPESSRS